MQYHPQYELTDYLDNAGGFNQMQMKKEFMLFHPMDKQSFIKKDSFQQNLDIIPGSTIFVPREVERYFVIL